MYEQYLQHHGILGMKWGVRRYQNKDGTLTSAGKRRSRNDYSNLSDEEMTKTVKRKNLEKQYAKATNARSTNLDATKKVVDNTSNLVNNLKNANNTSKKKANASMDLSNMTDKELRDRINRANLERQYTNMFSEETTSKGRSYASDILDTAGTALAVTSSALGIALAIKELRS